MGQGILHLREVAARVIRHRRDIAQFIRLRERFAETVEGGLGVGVVGRLGENVP